MPTPTPGSEEWRALVVEEIVDPEQRIGWHTAERPPTSDELVAAHGRYYRHMIESFGADRCLFESNFPVDRMSLSYPVLWSGLENVAAEYSADEREALFTGTATRFCSLE